jgi:hopanoid biosynthesis associated membrane protein HpnM
MPSIRSFVRSLSFGAAAALALIVTVAQAQASAGTASQAVNQFSTAIIAAVKGDGAAASPAGRYRQLGGLVSESFNLPVMMEAATGSRWRAANKDDRDRLTDAFLRMSIGTYLTRFEDYTGEYFVVTGEQPAIDGTTRVATRLVRPNRPDLSVTYVTQKFEDGWRIVDVVFGGGISELTVRKSEFAGLLTRGGLTGLTERLNEQADKILAQLGIPDGGRTAPTNAAPGTVIAGEPNRAR